MDVSSGIGGESGCGVGAAIARRSGVAGVVGAEGSVLAVGGRYAKNLPPKRSEWARLSGLWAPGRGAPSMRSGMGVWNRKRGAGWAQGKAVGRPSPVATLENAPKRGTWKCRAFRSTCRRGVLSDAPAAAVQAGAHAPFQAELVEGRGKASLCSGPVERAKTILFLRVTEACRELETGVCIDRRRALPFDPHAKG